MIKCDQTVLSDPIRGIRGNCFCACIASLLEMHLHEIPEFQNMGTRWYNPFRDFLIRSGYELIGTYYFSRPKFSWANLLEYSPGVDGFFIVNGQSPRTGINTTGHSVIYKECVLVHDPHPSRKGLVSNIDIMMIERRRKK